MIVRTLAIPFSVVAILVGLANVVGSALFPPTTVRGRR